MANKHLVPAERLILRFLSVLPFVENDPTSAILPVCLLLVST
jgi:hypothetical protein